MILQIKERTARSVPLGKTVNRNIGTPDSLSDTESSPYTRTPVRKSATPTFKGIIFIFFFKKFGNLKFVRI